MACSPPSLWLRHLTKCTGVQLVLTIVLIHVQMYVTAYTSRPYRKAEISSQKGVRSRPAVTLLVTSLLLFTFTSAFWATTAVIAGNLYRDFFNGMDERTPDFILIHPDLLFNHNLRLLSNYFASLSVSLLVAIYFRRVIDLLVFSLSSAMGLWFGVHGRLG
jgi:hypothetical protein